MPGNREVIKYIAALGLYYTGLLFLYSLVKRKILRRSAHVILMYHRVLDDVNSGDVYTQPGMAVSTATFHEQLRYLKERCDLLTVTHLARLIEKGEKTNRPAAVVTFDDGWRDNFVKAFPALKKHGSPATIYLTTDYVGTSRPFWFLMIKWLLTEGTLSVNSLEEIVVDIAGTTSSESEVLAELLRVIKAPSLDTDKIIEACKDLELTTLDRLIDAMLEKSRLTLEYWENTRPMMTWEEAMEMHKSGIEIGSHGCSHRILTLLPPQEIIRELVDSKSIIEAKLGASITSFSYPNGNFDDEIKESVRQAGYHCAVATSGKDDNNYNDDRYALKRVAVHEGVSTGLSGRFSKAMFAWHIIRHS